MLSSERKALAEKFVTPSLPIAKDVKQFILNLEALLFEQPLCSWMGVAVDMGGRLATLSNGGYWNQVIGTLEELVEGTPTNVSVGCAVQKALGNGPSCFMIGEGDAIAYRNSVDQLADHPVLVDTLSRTEVADLVSASDSRNVVKYVQTLRTIARAHDVELKYLSL